MSADEPQTDREWLMRIDGKIDNLLICQEDHEKRIRTVEDKQNQWIGKETVVPVIASVAVSLVSVYVGLKSIFGGS